MQMQQQLQGQLATILSADRAAGAPRAAACFTIFRLVPASSRSKGFPSISLGSPLPPLAMLFADLPAVQHIQWPTSITGRRVAPDRVAAPSLVRTSASASSSEKTWESHSLPPKLQRIRTFSALSSRSFLVFSLRMCVRSFRTPQQDAFQDGLHMRSHHRDGQPHGHHLLRANTAGSKSSTMYSSGPANSYSRRARAMTVAAIMWGVAATRPPSTMLNRRLRHVDFRSIIALQQQDEGLEAAQAVALGSGHGGHHASQQAVCHVLAVCSQEVWPMQEAQSSRDDYGLLYSLQLTF
ncbi:MAG: hypothetical protein FRX49_02854 [Trebouxia sp. A1-2]|nr:MAG: hypothetical protein FRX49_02854 [Trebouxia sp. A1-2]